MNVKTHSSRLAVGFLVALLVLTLHASQFGEGQPIFFSKTYAIILHNTLRAATTNTLILQKDMETLYNKYTSNVQQKEKLSFFQTHYLGKSIRLSGFVAPLNRGLKIIVDLRENYHSPAIRAILTPVRSQLYQSIYLRAGEKISFEGSISEADYSTRDGLLIHVKNASFVQ